MRIRLVALEGPDRGKAFQFDGYCRVVLGRSGSADVNGRRPTDPWLSRFHLLLESAGEACVVRDLGSRNGLAINGRRTEQGPLRAGDVLGAGHSTYRLEMDRSITTFTAEKEGDLPSPPAGPRLEDYEDEQLVAEGSLGAVYQARERLTGRTVALKLLRPERELEEGASDHFLREMEIWRKLHHPHIVRVYAVGRETGNLWIAMEYVEGPTLQEQVEIHGLLDRAEACRIGAQVLDALAYGHDRGIVHRDVKPQNILLWEAAGRLSAKLADYGLARSFLETCGARLTITGDVKGTPRFMAPEQLLDARRVGPAADLYSAGATLYFALTRQWHVDVAPVSRNPWGLVLEGPRIPLARRRPDLPSLLCATIDASLGRSPQERPASARVMAAALREALGGDAS